MERPQTARRLDLWIMTALAILTLAVFLQCAWHGFLNFDDDIYVYENPQVKTGLTWPNAVWAFVEPRIGHWHPLTWWSLMLDETLYAGWPGGFHITSLLLHLATGLLLYRFLRNVTDATAPCAAVAFLFLAHPLHVEPVAWISSRKDVLSGACLMAALIAYGHYIRRPNAIRYGWVVGWYILGILSKSMLMTFPVLLLLLDFWPLTRLQGAWKPRLIEKIPLFIIAGASVGIALWAGYRYRAIGTEGTYPLLVRLLNAPVNYAVYLRQTFCPTGLAPNYPATHIFRPWHEIFMAHALLLGVSAVVWLERNRRPYLLMGWLWFLIAMAPVSGIIQVGGHATADRYTYVPLVGIFIMAAWAGKEWNDRHPEFHRAARVLLCGVAIVLTTLAIRQTHFWKTPIDLWRHTLAVTRDNDKAMLNLGNELLGRGRYDEAAEQYQALLKLNPTDWDAQINLAKTWGFQGKIQEATDQLRRTIALEPRHYRAHLEMGRLCLKTGDLRTALTALATSVELRPEEPIPHFEYGKALMKARQWPLAREQFGITFQLDNTYAPALISLGLCQAAENDFSGAAESFARASQRWPANFEAWFNFGLALHKLERNQEATQALERACALKPEDAEARKALDLVRSASVPPASAQ